MKHAVITGGHGGLGKAIAEELREANWDVHAPGRSDLDVRNREDVGRYFENSACDLLVCCAGVVRDQILYRTDEKQWDETFAANFSGARFCAESAIEKMIKKGSGHVIFISSYAALHPEAGQAAYAASKAALLGLTHDLALRHGKHGIRVNVLLPGFLETGMITNIPETRRDKIRNSHVLGSFNRVERVAAFVRFLEEEMIFTSGQAFQLDSRLGNSSQENFA